MNPQNLTVKQISSIGIFSALCVVGAMIKIPAIVGSVAFDSAPALVSGILVGGMPGAFIGAIGHLLSALIAGMPLGPFHFMIAVEMSLLTYLFTMAYRKGAIFAIVIFVVGNGILAPLPFLFINGIGFYLTLLPSLLLASILNAIVAIFIIRGLSQISEGR